MALQDIQKIQAIKTTAAKAFATAGQTIKAYCAPITFRTTANSEFVLASFLTNRPVLQEAVGKFASTTPAENAVTFRVKPFYKQATLREIDVDLDNTGKITSFINSLRSSPDVDWDYQLSQLVVSCSVSDQTRSPTYDAVAPCATTHAGFTGSLQSNITTLSPTGSANLAAGFAAIQQFHDPITGRSLGLTADTIMCAPNVEQAVRIFAESETIPDATGQVPVTNPYKGRLSVIVNPNMASNKALMCVTSVEDSRPLQLMVANELALTDDTAQARESANYTFTVKGQAAIGYGPWFSMYYFNN